MPQYVYTELWQCLSMRGIKYSSRGLSLYVVYGRPLRMRVHSKNSFEMLPSEESTARERKCHSPQKNRKNERNGTEPISQNSKVNPLTQRRAGIYATTYVFCLSEIMWEGGGFQKGVCVPAARQARDPHFKHPHPFPSTSAFVPPEVRDFLVFCSSTGSAFKEKAGDRLRISAWQSWHQWTLSLSYKRSPASSPLTC